MSKYSILVLLSLNLVAGESIAADRLWVTAANIFECAVADTPKKYDDLFMISISKHGRSTLSYRRLTASAISEPRIVPGCANLVSDIQEHRPGILSYKCDNDGEDGFVEIDPKSGRGQIYFYKPKLGYDERVEISLSCI